MAEADSIINSQLQQAFPSIEQEDGNEPAKFSIKENIIINQTGERIQNRKGLGLSKDIVNTPSNIYGIFLNYDINDNDDLVQVQVKIPQQFNVQDTIEYVIDSFNEKFKSQNIKYKLTKDFNNWSLHVAKKSGKPKTDFPALDIDSKLQECGKINFSLNPKNVDNCIFNLEENNYVSNNNLTQRDSNQTDTTLQNSISGEQQQIGERNPSLQDTKKAYESSLIKKNKGKGKKKEKQDNQGGCFTCF
ncbi:hypothetical protein PPERSA_05068 [Pseudocohnilembus persalinus]|uniref:CRIM domain-containing protein n=1 Tax=Pseudocohnilembus persalinus TaxID=266149 RepID=A0A0V0QW33_PSEPJ|nr:hypothetical protein PPERSA_05068 [Pseudocohnilembus persalinus]|eukprot:KRX06455.1 hypothetical protein PPERSA_05068 [Pseudocohnilembus persalinus]